jgi:hypothetical protein
LSKIEDNTRRYNFRCYFMNPSPNYYDGRLATNFETCIKDKFEGLTQINEVNASYVKDEINKLLTAGGEDIRQIGEVVRDSQAL